MRQLLHDAVDGVDDVGARLLEDDQEHAGLAVNPAVLGIVQRCTHGMADVADTDGTAVPIGDDDVVPGLGLGELVVGIDGVGARVAVEGSLGIVDGDHRQRGAHVLQRQALGDQLGGIDLDTDRRCLLSTDADLADAADMADRLRELGVGLVGHLRHRQRRRGGAERENGRVGRIDLSVGRRGRHVLGQLPARRIDGGEHVGASTVDVAREIELQDDLGRAGLALRRHLRDAGNERKLRFERLRYR